MTYIRIYPYPSSKIYIPIELWSYQWSILYVHYTRLGIARESTDSMIATARIGISDHVMRCRITDVNIKVPNTNISTKFRVWNIENFIQSCCFRLNAVTVKDSYRLPIMDALLDRLGASKLIRTLEWNIGYWKVQITERDRHKTALTWHEGTYHGKRVLFGVRNAPDTLQRDIDIWMSGFRCRSCIVYLDDAIIFSKTFEYNVSLVKEVLTAL